MADGGEGRFPVLTEKQNDDVLSSKSSITPNLPINTQFPCFKNIASHVMDMPIHMFYTHCRKKPWTRYWKLSMLKYAIKIEKNTVCRHYDHYEGEYKGK